MTHSQGPGVGVGGKLSCSGLWVMETGRTDRHAGPHQPLCSHHGLCVPGQGASSGHHGGWGAPPPTARGPLPAWLSSPAPRPHSPGQSWVPSRSAPRPWALLLPLSTPGPLPALQEPLNRCHTPTFPQAPRASCCTLSHIPLPTGPHPVPQQGLRHQPTRARHRGVTCLNLGCREIARAAGPHGDVHPEANLGPAFPACSALHQALGPPGPLQALPCSQGSWVPCGPWASRGRAAAQSGSARLGWGRS